MGMNLKKWNENLRKKNPHLGEIKLKKKNEKRKIRRKSESKKLKEKLKLKLKKMELKGKWDRN